MAVAQGVAKKLSFIKEAAGSWGTTPANSSTWKFLRRVTSDLDVDKDTYSSNEIRTDYQVADFRHGGRKVTGTINGELSPGTYASFCAAALARDFAAVTQISLSATTLAVGAPSNLVSTLTRSAGSWFTDGVRVGHIIKITAGLVNAANINRHLMVVSMTSATVISAMRLDGVAMATESATANAVIQFPGKTTYTPQTGHTNDSFSIEHWYSDLVQSELFSGCRVNSLAFNLPATGMATTAINLLGKDVTTAASQYSSSSSAATATGTLAAVNGVLRAGGVSMGVVTGASINIARNASSMPVVGSNFSPDVFVGRVVVTGQLQALFDSVTLRDAFLNETETSVLLALSTGSLALSDVISFYMPRLKIGGARKNDGETGLQLTLPFQALYNSTSTNADGNEATTLQICDTQAP